MTTVARTLRADLQRSAKTVDGSKSLVKNIMLKMGRKHVSSAGHSVLGQDAELDSDVSRVI